MNLVVKRQRHHLGLTLLALLGVILAVGLVTNASFFAQAVDRVILHQELAEFSRITGRPPLSTAVYVFPSSRNPVRLDDAERLAAHVAGTLSAEVGLPTRHVGIQVSSGSMMLRPAGDSELYAAGEGYLENVEVVYISDVARRMKIVEGSPMDEGGKSGDVLDVWMHNRLAQKMGVHPGEMFNISFTLVGTPIPVRLAGFWEALDPRDEFWFNDPDAAFDSALLVRREDYLRFIQPVIPSGTRGANWYIILDDSGIMTRDTQRYIDGFRRGLDVINKYLPGARLNTPPLDPLAKFVQRSATLTVLLLGFNLPALGILLYFLILTLAIVAQWQRKETVIFVSRGMPISGVLNLALLEQLLLCIVGCPLGIAFGMLIAWLMGYTESFLSFTGRPPLPVSLQGFNPYLTVLALAISLLARIIPALGAARQSLVIEERERARPARNPFWLRYYLDFLLLLPTLYAYDQLNKRGSLAGLVTKSPEDLYKDPLLVLVPALFALTASLLTMRLFPLIMRLIDTLANHTPWLTVHLALRQLGRRSQDYIKPLLLVIVSLALGVYTMSMAASLDRWLVERIYYRVGADMVFTPKSMFADESGEPGGGSDEYVGGDWIPEPAVFKGVEGVIEATRVGDFAAHIYISAASDTWGRFLAIDRLDFPKVAWFRSDFAAEPLGGLMNRLAWAQDGVLVSRNFLSAYNLHLGDKLLVTVSLDESLGVQSQFTIAGVYDYFPTCYEEEEGVTLIGNLDHLSTLIGMTPFHKLWLKLKPGVSAEAVVEALPRSVQIAAGTVWDAREIVATERAKMERVGIFGTLSVGFLAASFMAVLALLVYSLASLQERVYSFAVMHAIGLSRGQIITQVIAEYAFLSLFGVLAGTGVGMLVSELFIPFFRYTGERGTPLPPLLPIIAVEDVRSLAVGFALFILFAEIVIVAIPLYRRLIPMLKRHWI